MGIFLRKKRTPAHPGFPALPEYPENPGVPVLPFLNKKTPLNYCDFKKIALNLQCLHADGIMCAGIAAQKQAAQKQAVSNANYQNQFNTPIAQVPETSSSSTTSPQTVKHNVDIESVQQQKLDEYNERAQRLRDEERALKERQSNAYLERTQRGQKLQEDLKRAEQWFTSDVNWNQLVISSVQTYGYEATERMIKEKRANAVSGMGQAQTGEILVNGVLSNGQHVKLKITNDRVVAYSVSDNSSQNRMNWTSTFRNTGEGQISPVGAKDPFEFQRRFQNKAYISNLGTVYF